jgi:hypothetical protein
VKEPLAWSDGAVAAIEAVKYYVSNDGILYLRDALLGWILRTKPGESAIGRALRDSTIWTGIHQASTGQPGVGLSIYNWQQEIEAQARADGSRRIGERHILATFTDDKLSYFGILVPKLREAVRISELGPEFPKDQIDGRWHGLIDANTVVQFQPIDQIKWLEEVSAKAATIWLTNSLLNELDGMKFYSDSGRVRDKARAFTLWLSERLDQALRPEGADLRKGVVLRVWAPAELSGARDTDHLEAAFALRERGVPVTIVTADTGLEARAKASGVAVHKLAERWQLPPEPTAKDKLLSEMMKRAQLEASPKLRLKAEIVRELLMLSIENEPSAGEARDVIVLFDFEGAETSWIMDGSGNGYVLREHPWYRVHLRAALPPGSADPVAQVNYDRIPPPTVAYEIRASREPPMRGRLILTDGQFVEQEAAAP